MKTDHYNHQRGTNGFSLLAGAVLLAAPLSAQSVAETASAKKEEEIVKLSAFQVSTARDTGYFSDETLAGTRTRKRLIDLVGSVAVVNPAMISDFDVRNIHAVIGFAVSGVTPNERVSDDVNIRGFRAQRVFRDGIVTGVAGRMQLYDVERLEVVKGPVAMIFGNSAALGGALNIVSKKPTGTQEGEMALSAGENNYLRSSLSLSGPLTAKKNIRYRFTLGGQHDDRIKEIESDDQKFFGGALDADLGNSTLSLYGYRSVNTGYSYSNDFLDVTTYGNGVMKLNPLSTEEFSLARSKDVYKNDYETYLLASMVTRLTDQLNTRLLYRYSYFEPDWKLIRGSTVAANNYTLGRVFLPLHQFKHDHALQMDGTYKLDLAGGKHELSAGVDYSRIAFRALQATVSIPSIDTRRPDYSVDDALPKTWLWNNTNSTSTTEQISYYVQDYVTLFNEQLSLVGGLRWIETQTVFENFRTTPNTTTTAGVPAKPVHRYGVIYKPRKDISIYYTNAATFQSNSGVNHLGEPLKDSDGTMDEFGVKLTGFNLLGGRVFGAAAYFDMALTNVPTTGFFIPALLINEVLQTAKTVSKGYEVEFGYHRPTSNGTVDFLFTYYNADSTDATGQRAVNAVKEAYSLLFKYAFEKGALRGLSFGLGGHFEGPKLARLSGQFLVDYDDNYELFVNYRFNKSWRVSLNISNLTNTRYAMSFRGNPGVVEANDPRMIRMSVFRKW